MGRDPLLSHAVLVGIGDAKQRADHLPITDEALHVWRHPLRELTVDEALGTQRRIRLYLGHILRYSLNLLERLYEKWSSGGDSLL
jgi:hypothetical protein